LYEYFEAGLHRNRILEIEDLIAAQNRWIVVAPERRALFELFQALGDLHLQADRWAARRRSVAMMWSMCSASSMR
jgi:hypothetical protein